MIALHFLIDCGQRHLARLPLCGQCISSGFDCLGLCLQLALGLGNSVSIQRKRLEPLFISVNALLLRLDDHLEVGEISGDIFRVLIPKPDAKATALLQ